MTPPGWRHWTARSRRPSQVAGSAAQAADRVVTINGIFRPFALVRGRGVATWGLARGRVTLAPFAPLAAADEAVLMADAADVLRFLGERGTSRPR
jgi:hypothetical protein